MRKKVLLTGASGYISNLILPELQEKYDLRLVDVRKEDSKGNLIEGIEVVDLLSEDYARLKNLFTDIDMVVHTGYFRPQGVDHQSLYEGERKNVDMMQRVYQLSLECGVKKVVSASTNQAAKWYEKPYYQKLKDRVDPYEYPRPDNFYGWAKAAYESLGFLYACGSLGRQLEIIQLRIVVPREVDPNADDLKGQPTSRYIRDIAGYISKRDLQQLYIKSLETEKIEDEYGVPFHIFYGVSDNARSFWSITNARKVIGYAPEDDSEIQFAKDIHKITNGK